MRRLERKVEAGAQFAVTQPVYDEASARMLAEVTRHLDIPVTLDELRSLRVIRNISESEVIVLSGPDAPPQVCNVYREYEMCSRWEVRVRVMRSSAHPQGVFVYRIEMGGGKLVFATDVEGYAGGDR